MTLTYTFAEIRNFQKKNKKNRQKKPNKHTRTLDKYVSKFDWLIHNTLMLLLWDTKKDA